MQTSKLLVAVCAISFCASSISFAKADDPAQEKAREALRQKMADLDAQQAAAKPTAPAPVPASPTETIIQTTVVTPQPAPAAAPVITTPVTVVTAQPVTSPEAMIVTPPAVVVAPIGETFAPVPPPTSDAATERAREVLRQKMGESSAVASAPAADTAGKEAATRQTQTPNVSPARKTAVTQPSFPPLEAPPAPISAAKQAQLADLLQKYKADQLTPDQYHTARARILAEP